MSKTSKNKSTKIKSKAESLPPVGVVTHYFSKIHVVIVRFKKPIKVGAKVGVKGATTDFSCVIKSMQYNHQEIKSAKKLQEVGIKVPKKARSGDKVYLL